MCRCTLGRTIFLRPLRAVHSPVLFILGCVGVLWLTFGEIITMTQTVVNSALYSICCHGSLHHCLFKMNALLCRYFNIVTILCCNEFSSILTFTLLLSLSTVWVQLCNNVSQHMTITI